MAKVDARVIDLDNANITRINVNTEEESTNIQLENQIVKFTYEGTSINTLEVSAAKDGNIAFAANLPTKEYVDDKIDTTIYNNVGNLANLNTINQDNIVAAINEVKSSRDVPFVVKHWATSSINVEIPSCTSDIANISIQKMVFRIKDQEAVDYQIVGMIAYEVFDSAGERINCWPVCQFTGQGQTELSVRWVCAGSTTKIATRVTAWVLLMHRSSGI